VFPCICRRGVERVLRLSLSVEPLSATAFSRYDLIAARIVLQP
jgi:hypothetical protein